MRKLIRFFVVLALFLVLPVSAKADKLDLYLFHSESCTHCQAEIEWLNSVKDEYDLELHLYEVTNNKENAELVKKIKKQMKVNNAQVPFTIVGNTYYIGFEDSIKDGIEQLIKDEISNPSPNVIDMLLNNQSISNITIRNGQISKIHTVFGDVDPNSVSLPILAVIIGFIDGFNPCAMWVLIFLISMLFNMKDRKKMWILGITFLVSSAFVYLLFMLAWLKIIDDLSSIVWFRLLIALIALIGGSINLRSFYRGLKKDDGCEVVDDKKRKKIFAKIKGIVNEKSFIIALIGVITLAFSVNIIELACSAGLPLIFTQILTLSHISVVSYLIYILIYIFFFLIDDIVVFSVAMITLNVTGISTKYTKYSHLIGGIIMILIAILMAFKPEWLMMNFH